MNEQMIKSRMQQFLCKTSWRAAFFQPLRHTPVAEALAPKTQNEPLSSF
jgi:hypothetical protein